MKNSSKRKTIGSRTCLAALCFFLARSNAILAADPIEALTDYLNQPSESREPINSQEFATQPLNSDQAASAHELLANDWRQRTQKASLAEMEASEIVSGDLSMPFFYKVFGEKPDTGRSLFISMHGGGGAPKRVNDRQWENQKRLYTVEEGVYLAPRAPTNTWNLWHQGHIDEMFDRLIRNLVVTENVNPDRVYLMGYSAGGDGVYQLAPRMADRFAAAAMMAGHPNETSPLGLRNLPFALYMGGKDAAYKRNEIAAEWKIKLADLQKADPDGYRHLVTIYPEKGHWMDREDASSIPWMSEFIRNSFPKRIVWKQDDVKHDRFYWLSVDAEKQPSRATIVAEIKGQTVSLEADGNSDITVRLHDKLVDMDAAVSIEQGDKVLFEGKVPRTIATINATINERDPRAAYFGQVTVSLK